jgi:hypothetical protein
MQETRVARRITFVSIVVLALGTATLAAPETAAAARLCSTDVFCAVNNDCSDNPAPCGDCGAGVGMVCAQDFQGRFCTGDQGYYSYCAFES